MSRYPRILLAFSAFLLLSIRVAYAQHPRIQHSVNRTAHQPPLLGRDYWFCVPTNYGSDLGGKYIALYVTSPDSGVVKVERQGDLVRSVSLTPFKTAVLNLPLTWEMQSSGKVENLGIHVWSDRDIECHVMCHNAYTSDGFTVIPSIGWGKEY